MQMAFAQRRKYRTNKVEPELFMHEMKRYCVMLAFHLPRGGRARFEEVLLSPQGHAIVATALAPIHSWLPRPSQLQGGDRG